MVVSHTLDRCPLCGSPFVKGFSARASPLSFITAEKMVTIAFADQDLHRAGFRKWLPWKAWYSASFHCSSCELYVVQYGLKLSRAEAKRVAKNYLTK